MSLRHSTKTVFGAFAVLAFGASVALAQDTTRTRPTSARRIPISKEGTRTAGGEVSKTVIHDTVTVFKTDTLRLSTPATITHDTVTVTKTVTHTDTVQLAPPIQPIHLPGGLYFGVGAGVSAPNGALFTPNSAGPAAQLQLGWQGAKQLIGVRGDVNWTKPGEDSRFAAFQADPDVLNFSADVKLQLPFLTHTFGARHRFGLYGIGGYTHTMYKGLPIRVESGGTDVVAGLPINRGTTDWTHNNGWNAGGGASLGWGRTEIFFETRVLAFSHDNIPQARQMPFVLGLNFY